jgi:hypothetical protein
MKDRESDRANTDATKTRATAYEPPKVESMGSAELLEMLGPAQGYGGGLGGSSFGHQSGRQYRGSRSRG